MPEDRQTYQRAASAALWGLAAQFVLSVAITLIGLWSNSPALHAATFHFFGGLPIWIILWMLYNQHRLERIETLEAEQLAGGDATTAAIFDEHGADLQIAQRRLRGLYKWGLGIVSSVVAVYLLAAGGTYLYMLGRMAAADAIRENVSSKSLLTVSLAVAFVAFIVARWVAGMTRVNQWQLLRGGASYLMGCVLIAVLTCAAAIVDLMKVDGVFVVLSYVVPILMVWLGIEIIVTFLLSAYRPRRPGEIARPAFDSRSLGLLTSPESIAKAISDTINYQFGFEISRSWFYQLLSRAITPLVVLGAAVLILVSSFVVVDPHEQAIISRFGKITAIEPPGLHVKWPWPIAQARKFPVGRIHQVSVGSVRTSIDRTKAILWTTEHTTDGEEYLITAQAPLPADFETSGQTAAGGAPGMALVAADVAIQFRIASLEQFVLNATDPRRLNRSMRQREQWAKLLADWEAIGRQGPDPLAAKQPIDPCPMLSAIANQRVNAYFARHDIDTLLASGRMAAGEELRKQIQQDVNRHQLGLNIVFVGLAGIHPPQQGQVAEAFHEQIKALQQKQSAIQKANAEQVDILAGAAGSQAQALALYEVIIALEEVEQRISQLRQQENEAEPALLARRDDLARKVNGMLAESQGAAAELLYDALAYRWRRLITERAKAARFDAQLASFEHAPHYYKTRLLLDVLAEGIGQSRKLVVPADTRIRVEAKDAESDLGNLFGEEQ